MLLSHSVVVSPSGKRSKKRVCVRHSITIIANESANPRKPAVSALSSANVCGTSSETTRSVTANAKTASENASRRDGACSRERNGLGSRGTAGGGAAAPAG